MNDDPGLELPLDESDALQIQETAHRAIRHAYEQVVTCLARLSSFGAATGLVPFSPVYERQRALAIDDLTHLALHGRRLVDEVGARRRFRTIEVPNAKGKPDGKALPVFETMNSIVHHRRIEIFRTVFETAVAANSSDAFDYIMQRNTFHPLVVVESDRKRILMFRLLNLTETVQDRILGPIIDLCSENGLYLDDE